MTKKFTYTQKSTGDTLSATEWNNLAQDVDAAVDAINNGGVGGGSSAVSVTEDTLATDPTANVTIASGVTEIGSPEVIQLTKKSKGVNTTIVSGNNVNIEPRESTGKAKNTKGGNISLKPGDDIELCSHHRRFGNRDEVTVKVLDGDDNPVKLQIKAGDITLSSEGKASTMAKDEDTGLDTETPLYSDPNVMNINVTTGEGKGYLKVRAQAIDLRCEDHGGIALQPKGEDSDHNMNKIKFEHGGGDGLEFGTFNTEHTSIYTGDYRFKKDGIIRLADRFIETSDKVDANDDTTMYKYSKNNSANNTAKATATGKTFDAADDFYDFVDSSDPVCTWGDIVKFIAWAKENHEGPFDEWDVVAGKLNASTPSSLNFTFTEADGVTSLSDFSSHIKLYGYVYNATPSNANQTPVGLVDAGLLTISGSGNNYTISGPALREYTGGTPYVGSYTVQTLSCDLLAVNTPSQSGQYVSNISTSDLTFRITRVEVI